jgi:membrane-associated phospholipid phosphatase
MMEDILDWGVAVVLWLQQFSPFLDSPFKVFTFMGEEEFFMLLLPLFYWCLDRQTGVRLTLLFLFSAYLNALAKVLVAQPRPFQFDPRVKKLFEAGGGGLPSGHTQNTIIVWGFLALQFRRRWLWIVSGLLAVFIPLSRVYLGLHFPTDLLGGYLLGTILLILYMWSGPTVESWLKKKGPLWQFGAVFALSVLLILLFPIDGEYGLKIMAIFLGMGTGFILERCWVRFESGGRLWKQALRFLLGSVIIFSLRSFLKASFSELEPPALFRFIRYMLMGWCGALAVPWIFVKLRLAKPN